MLGCWQELCAFVSVQCRIWGCSAGEPRRAICWCAIARACALAERVGGGGSAGGRGGTGQRGRHVMSHRILVNFLILGSIEQITFFELCEKLADRMENIGARRGFASTQIFLVPFRRTYMRATWLSDTYT